MLQSLILTASDYIISTIDNKAKESIIEDYKQFDWSVSLFKPNIGI